MNKTSIQSVRRATKKSLANYKAHFSVAGLRFHCAKLDQYTNPKGSGLDKIHLNTRCEIKEYHAQFEPSVPIENACAKAVAESPPEDLIVKPRRRYLRKKAQYNIADHLLGFGQKAYWTGSTGKSTLLGLDIDDHESSDPATVQANAEQALKLFCEMTGLSPFPCKSDGGINAYLIVNKSGLTTRGTNETWHSIIRLVNREAKRRGLAAKLECKGKARVFDKISEYCGVLFKDPFTGLNPSDEELHHFWDYLEANALSGGQLSSLATTLHSEEFVSVQIASGSQGVSPANDSDNLIPMYKGNWAACCRDWALHGLPCEDSIFPVVSELAKWLYFIELWDVPELDRLDQVVNLLIEYCFNKHNGFITRLNLGRNSEVQDQIGRIVDSVVSRTSESGKAVFAGIRAKEYKNKWELVRLMLADASSSSTDTPLSFVKITECCSVTEKPEWLPKNEYWRNRASNWEYIPDETPLPAKLDAAIRRYYKNRKLKINKRIIIKLVRFLNHLRANEGEARLGIESLKKMGFTSHAARQHIEHLKSMYAIEVSGYCPVAGLSKLFKLREPVREMFGMKPQCAE